MKKGISILFAVITWFTVIMQYFLMIETRNTSISEITIRFFSFFTVLTNTLVAIYFTLVLFKHKKKIQILLNRSGILTAITVYITIVGLIYQLILRFGVDSTGIQMVVNELLHSLIPVVVIVFWYVYEDKSLINYKQIPLWLIFPVVYLIYVLIRGYYSNFYPYPFVDVKHIGLLSVIANGIGLLILFIGISALFIRMGKFFKKREKKISGGK